jgi:hypothetical protein
MAYTKTRVNEVSILPYYLNGSRVKTTIVVPDFTRSGKKVDNWKDRIKAGIQAGSEYSIDNYQWVHAPIQGPTMETAWCNKPIPPNPTIFGHEGQRGFYRYVPGLNNQHLGSTNLTVEQQSLSRVLSRIRDTRSSLNGLTVLGELRETIRMLKRPFASSQALIAKYLNSLGKTKRGLRGNPKVRRNDFMQAAADTWLEVAFGLRPLMGDVKAISEAILRFTDDAPQRVRVSAQASEFFSQTNVGGVYVPLVDHLTLLFDSTQKVTQRYCRYLVGLESTREAATGNIANLTELLGFTPENFVPALWELCPWSFLADYFGNIGEIIEAGCTSTQGVKWIVRTSGQQTILSNQEMQAGSEAYISSFNYVPLGQTRYHAGVFTLRRITFARTLPASLGVPDFRFSFPGSGMKVANMLALFQSESRKLARGF